MNPWVENEPRGFKVKEVPREADGDGVGAYDAKEKGPPLAAQHVNDPIEKGEQQDFVPLLSLGSSVGGSPNGSCPDSMVSTNRRSTGK